MCGKEPMTSGVLFRELFRYDAFMREQIKNRIAESEKRFQAAIDRGEVFPWSTAKLMASKPVTINDFMEM